MSVRALTIDFWNTMVVAQTGGDQRLQHRIRHLTDVARTCSPEVTEERIRIAYAEATRRFHDSWHHRHCTPSTSELVQCIWDTLELELDGSMHDDTVRVFEEGLLHGPPDLAPDIHEALAWAAARLPLAVISDTMFSPGRVIRAFLESHDLLAYFSAFVFSDETGYAKPDVRAFEQAASALGVLPAEIAHVGDLHRTDVAGARRAGATAILFTGIHRDPAITAEPHAVLESWRALPRVLGPLLSPKT